MLKHGAEHHQKIDWLFVTLQRLASIIRPAVRSSAPLIVLLLCSQNDNQGLGFTLGGTPPFGPRGVVVGRIIDGEAALRQLLRVAPTDVPLRLTRWQPTK